MQEWKEHLRYLPTSVLLMLIPTCALASSPSCSGPHLHRSCLGTPERSQSRSSGFCFLSLICLIVSWQSWMVMPFPSRFSARSRTNNGTDGSDAAPSSVSARSGASRGIHYFCQSSILNEAKVNLQKVGVENGIEYQEKKSSKKKFLRSSCDVGLIRTDAPEGTRFLVLRIRPLCHHAEWLLFDAGLVQK